MSINVSDVILRLNDHLGNYSTGQSSTAQRLRAVDSAVNYLKNMIGMPNDERLYQFYFSADNLYYDLPADYQEPVAALFYATQANNLLGNSWDYRPYQEVLPRMGAFPNQNTFSYTTINGSPQLLCWGNNIVPTQLIESFDTNIWTTSGDASANHLDDTIFYQGTASNNFTITYSTGVATLTYPAPLFLDAENLFQRFGNFNLYVDFASIDVTSVDIKLITSTGNYYKITATTQSTGATWTLNQWNKIVFPTTDAVTVGAPDAANITALQIDFNIPNTFGTVANMRVDFLFETYPDLLNFPYLSTLKGVDQNGNEISTVTATTDVLHYGADFIEPISLQAALYVWPQLRGDPNFMAEYNRMQRDTLKTWARRYPKMRFANNFLRTVINRS